MQNEEPARHVSLPSLIAWLGLCLLSAAWVRSGVEPWQGLWLQSGAFGIVAAVGLGNQEKTRRAYDQTIQEQSLQLRIESRMAQWKEWDTVIGSIKVAIDEIRGCAASQDRSLDGYPLKIVLVTESDSCGPTSVRAFAGVLRNFSASFVNFEHQEVIAEGAVILIFTLSSDRELCLVVSLTETQTTVKGFFSCGTVIAAGVSNFDHS